jgi:hypothetical protein
VRAMRLMAGAVGLLVASEARAQFYFNNFNAGAGNFEVNGSFAFAGLVPPNADSPCDASAYCTNFLGYDPDGAGAAAPQILGNDVAALNLAGLPVHTDVTISFLLCTLRSMDGGPSGNDDIRFAAAGTPFFDGSFANFAGNSQTYCPGVASPCLAGTSAVEVDRLGYNWGGRENAVYSVSYTFAHTDPFLSLAWTGSGQQGAADEGWGIDDVRIDLVTPQAAVPEPTTVALVGGGLLALAGIARRRRA